MVTLLSYHIFWSYKTALTYVLMDNFCPCFINKNGLKMIITWLKKLTFWKSGFKLTNVKWKRSVFDFIWGKLLQLSSGPSECESRRISLVIVEVCRWFVGESIRGEEFQRVGKTILIKSKMLLFLYISIILAQIFKFSPFFTKL